MPGFDRLPAIPLIASDPYFSIWSPADRIDTADIVHWCGDSKPIRGSMTVDGKAVRFLGKSDFGSRITEQKVTATQTIAKVRENGVELTVTFASPAFPDDPDAMSMPVTLVKFALKAMDGQPHDVRVTLSLSDTLCYDGNKRPELYADTFTLNGWPTAILGQKSQRPLSNSGDHITIDWGYLYLCAEQGEVRVGEWGLESDWQGPLNGENVLRAVIAYDDIASINYFGTLCKAWYRRNGAQITDAITFVENRFDALLSRCCAWDERIHADALAAADEDYAFLCAASWRHTLAAHKLIAAPNGEMVLLSKENDSNGCIGTADVSYPSIPLFLRYSPELVNALCRGILDFAEMPVWAFDFAPHDIGRYPMATGQVYAARRDCANGLTHPPYYLYPAGCNVYDPRYQMPVEECGNMLIMLAAAQRFGASAELANKHRATLNKWVQYLLTYGEDPGEQLCTDDFAGHLAHNVNLAAKAIVGVACYGLLTNDAAYPEKAKGMARRLMARIGANGNTPLSLDGKGWSMKYNLLWDKVLGLSLLPDGFYAAEIESYLPRVNAYGLPLDSRSDYTKSDWICWVAAMADDMGHRRALLKPVTKYLRETETRVPFSDWYDTKTGRYVHFIARSVQGGVFAPMLRLPRG